MTVSGDAPDTYVSPEMEAAVGGLLMRQVSYPIAESDIRRWAIAVYYPEEPPRLFWDAEYAKATRHGGIVAPEEFNAFAWMVAEPAGLALAGDLRNDPDRTEKQLGIAGPGLQFQLNGGIEVSYGVRMRPRDVITAEQRLSGYSERQGRLGLMLFTATETTWTNQRQELVKKTVGTVIRYGKD